jgi:hypothetical protein
VNKIKGNGYNWILPSLQELIRLYFEELLSISDIASRFNVTDGAVRLAFSRGGVRLRSMSDAQSLKANYIPITDRFLSFINGLILGDGCVSPSVEKKSCTYRHTDKHLEYLEWLIEAFNGFGVKCTKPKKTGNYWAMNTGYYRDFVPICSLWYPEGKKKIPDDLQIHPITLFNWYIGDGSHDKKSKSTKVVICSQFDRYGLHEVSRKLSTLGIETSIYSTGLYIRRESRNRFFEYITDHEYVIPSCYEYKF